jgi:hypothetical protein
VGFEVSTSTQDHPTYLHTQAFPPSFSTCLSNPASSPVPPQPPHSAINYHSAIRFSLHVYNRSLRKYYYVQISTGQSTWDKPTEPAPGAPTASATTTPAQGNPTHPPPTQRTMSSEGQHQQDGTRGMGGNQHGESTDRAGGLGVRYQK